MKKQLALLVLGLVAVLVLCGQLARASSTPSPRDPQDTEPYWSWDARYVAFDRQKGAAHRTDAVPAGNGRVRYLDNGTPRGYQPHGSAYLVQRGDRTWYVSSIEADGFDGTDASWSNDGHSIAFLRGTTLVVMNAGAFDNQHIVATNVTPPSWDVYGPVWSPDDSEIVIASGSSLLLVNTDGSGSKTIFTGANQSVNPSWSPDGKTIAFERNAGAYWSIWTVQSDGTGALKLIGNSNNRFPQFSPYTATLAFISDRGHVRGGATRFRYALYTQAPGEPARELVDDVHPYSPPRWSPTGAQIAVAAGQKCLRWGIYVVRSSGGQPHRRSNLCR